MSQAAHPFPPPVTEPLGAEAVERLALLPGARAFVRRLLGGEPVRVALRTGTPVDVGSWLGRRRIRVCALADRLVLWAWGPRPYDETIPFQALRRSLYNHVTGELALAPAPDARVRRLRMPPLEAYQLMAQFHQEDRTHA